MNYRIGLVFTMALLTGGAAYAQTAPALSDPEQAYEAARNQLGILKYCQAQGFIGGDAITVQEKLLSMVPPGDTAKGDAAEAKGVSGMVSALGTEMMLDDGAKQQNTTSEALCKQMETLINQMAAQIPG